MYRNALFGFAIALSLLAGPLRAAADEREDGWAPEGDPGERAERAGGADVSVDLAGSTPGLDERVFRSTLSEHGDWYASARYGSVWRPRVAIGWRPYYYGSWLWTDEGWYWDSAEPFAWAVYHYGRWVFDPAWGWVWVPGYQWAPAWVAWRYGGDVVGWAPLGPGVSVYVTAYPFVDFWWTFVPTTRFVGVPVYTVAYGPRDTRHWFGTTEPAPPRGVAPPRGGRAVASAAWGGPSRRVIEDRIGRPIAPAFRSPGAPARRDERGAAPGLVRPAPGGGREGLRPEPRAFPRGEESRPAVRPEPRGGFRGGDSSTGVRPEPRFEPPRRDFDRPPASGPLPRREVERPAVRPEPRGEGERPTVRPEPRGEGERPAFRPPAREGGERPRRER